MFPLPGLTEASFLSLPAKKVGEKFQRFPAQNQIIGFTLIFVLSRSVRESLQFAKPWAVLKGGEFRISSQLGEKGLFHHSLNCSIPK